MQTLLRFVVLLILAALLFGAFGWALAFALRSLNLHPPEQLTIAAGPPGTAYHTDALAYQRLLAEDDITLVILETAGSVENAARLSDDAAEPADIALVQGGVPLGDGIEGLAAVYVEPIWLMARAEVAVDADPHNWHGLRVAAGVPGSGVRLVADQLAAITGATAFDRDQAIALGSAAAAESLLNGELDVALFVAPARAAYLQPLYYSDEVRPVMLAHPEALTLRLDAARAIRLPSGILDYHQPIPAEDIELVGLITRLVARDGLHPALVNRLVRAVREIHGGTEVIPANRQYPSAEDMDVGANPYAKQLLEEGFSSLERYLPYWVVAQLNRILLVLLPALLLLLPLLKLLPAIYQWVFRGRVYRHYARVHEIDRLVGVSGESLDPQQREALRNELSEIERRLREANLPNSYRKEAYTLMHHLEYVRNRIALPE